MKKFRFLKNLTFLEIVLNSILVILFFIGVVTPLFKLSAGVMISAGILHVTSMILHWLTWNQLPITHQERITFNLWVLGAFMVTGLSFVALPMLAIMMLYVLLFFAVAWFIFYCHILWVEYKFLKRKVELYSQRELIHF